MNWSSISALDLLKELREKFFCGPNADDQGKRPVSNKQLQRWLEGGAVEVNGEKVKPFEEIILPIVSLRFFPKKKEKIITIR